MDVRARPRRTLLLAAGVALVVVVLVAAVVIHRTTTDSPRTERAPAPEGNYLTSCVEIPRIRSLDDVQTVMTKVRGAPEVQGADVGADLLLSDGRRIWVTGDTLRSASFRGQRFVRNSMLMVSSGCLQTVLPRDNGAVIPDRSDGVGYWPMSLGKVVRDGVDVVGVGVQRVRSTGTVGSMDFENLGSAIAVFHVRPGGVPELVEVKDLGADDPSRTRPTWGAAVAVADDWVYLYGTSNPDTPGIYGYALQVARVRIDHIRDQTRWRYWDGTAWVRQASTAKVLIPAQGGVSQTLSVFAHDGAWYVVSKQDEFLGDDLVVWKGPSPTGPFHIASRPARIPSDTTTGELRYMPLAHPELLPEKGSVVVSYSRNNTDLSKVEQDPFLYRPSFLRIDLP